tara:strand:- start:535 stop:1416 length:882 start_codon:yes stop_codon:yes gene_type:complete
MSKKYKNIVFSGGSIRGLSYIGCLKSLEERGIMEGITTFAGASIGSIVSTMIYLGFSSTELYQLMMAIKLEDLKNIEAENIMDFFKTFGVDDGSKFRKLIEICIRKRGFKHDINFQEAYNIIKKKLIIVGSCLNTQSADYFSHETTPEMKIVDAIMASISIPFYFTMKTYGEFSYSDGGLIDNYPIQLFKDEIDETLGFLICENVSIYNKVDGIDKFTMSVISCMNNQLQKLYLELYRKWTILIHLNYNCLHFKLSDDEKNHIINTGYEETNKFFHRKKLEGVLENISLAKSV